MSAPRVYSSFRRGDLIAAFERGPQQVRPARLGRLTRDQLLAAMTIAWSSPAMVAVVQAIDSARHNQAATLARYIARSRAKGG